MWQVDGPINHLNNYQSCMEEEEEEKLMVALAAAVVVVVAVVALAAGAFGLISYLVGG